MIRLPLKERQPLRVVVERMAAKGHRISHIVEYFAEGSSAQGPCGRAHLSQERRQGPGEHGSHHPAKPTLYGLVQMEREAHSGQARGAGTSGTLGTGAGRARRTLRQEELSAVGTTSPFPG